MGLKKKAVDYGTREVSECPFPVFAFDFIHKGNKKLIRRQQYRVASYMGKITGAKAEANRGEKLE